MGGVWDEMYRHIPFDDGVYITTLCAANSGALLIGCSNGDVVREPHVGHYVAFHASRDPQITDLICAHSDNMPVLRVYEHKGEIVSCTCQQLTRHTHNNGRFELVDQFMQLLVDATPVNQDLMAYIDDVGSVHVHSKRSGRTKTHALLGCTALHSKIDNMLVMGHADGRATVNTVCRNGNLFNVLEVQADNDAPITQVCMVARMEFVTCARHAHSPVWWWRQSVRDRHATSSVRLEGHWQPVTSISSHGPLVATASNDSTVRVWREGKCVHLVAIDIAQMCTAVTFLHPTMLAFGTSTGNVFVQSFTLDTGLPPEHYALAQDVADQLGVVVPDACLALVLRR